jgi:hypothetical protein
MPNKKRAAATDDRRKSGQSVPAKDTGNNDETPMDPTNPASKPHGTTSDQVSEMEGEGQAQGGNTPPSTNNK